MQFRQTLHTSKQYSPSVHYPFGMAMQARSFSIQAKYRYGFNTQERDLELGGDVYTAEYWEYDGKLCRRWNLDPISFPYLSLYGVNFNSPVNMFDIKGDVGKYGRTKYTVETDDKGNVSYKFGKKGRALSEMSKDFQEGFNKEVAPVFEAMAKSKAGREDIEKINNESMVYEIYADDKTMSGLNSIFTPLKFGKNSYKHVKIEINLGNYEEGKKSGKIGQNTSKEEWISSVMTVEIDHSLPESLKLLRSIYYDNVPRKDRQEKLDNTVKPGTEEFVKYYSGPLQKAVEHRIKFRIENNVTIDNDVLDPIKRSNTQIDGKPQPNQIPYNDYIKQKIKENNLTE